MKLTHEQQNALVMLGCSPDGLPIGRCTDGIGRVSGRTARLLQERGLVEIDHLGRFPSPHAREWTLIEITQAGRAVLPECRNAAWWARRAIG